MGRGQGGQGKLPFSSVPPPLSPKVPDSLEVWLAGQSLENNLAQPFGWADETGYRRPEVSQGCTGPQ